MATYDEPCRSTPRDLKLRLENELVEINAHKAKLEAALRFLSANPDAQALWEITR